LFLIVFEGLAGLVGEVCPMEIGRLVIKVNLLQFGNDTLMFCLPV